MGDRDQKQDIRNQGSGSERGAEAPPIAPTEAFAFFRDLQERLHNWRVKNFPESEHEEQLFGVVEEIGELCRHYLKQRQGIRGSYLEHEVEIQDAIGDTLIYLAGFCSFKDYDLMHLYYRTAHRVTMRDWIKDSQRGGE